MMQSPLLEFRSTTFEVTDGEDEETNPGIYGKSLATWLAARLGVADDEVIAEDFGWCVPVKSPHYRLYIACSSEDDSRDRWRVFVFAEGGLFSRLLGRDTRTAEVTSVFARVKEILGAHRGVFEMTERRTA